MATQEYRITCDECENESNVTTYNEEEIHPCFCPLCGVEAESELSEIHFED